METFTFTEEEFLIFEKIQNLLIKYDLKSLKFLKTRIYIKNNHGEISKFKFSKFNKSETKNKKFKLRRTARIRS